MTAPIIQPAPTVTNPVLDAGPGATCRFNPVWTKWYTDLIKLIQNILNGFFDSITVAGDADIGGNVNVGGNLDVTGSAEIHSFIVVDGDGLVKGIFAVNTSFNATGLADFFGTTTFHAAGGTAPFVVISPTEVTNLHANFATKLFTGRGINGVDFDGTSNIVISTAPSGWVITGAGSTTTGFAIGTDGSTGGSFLVGTDLRVGAKFGCNGKLPQAAVPSDTTLATVIAALQANGIMS